MGYCMSQWDSEFRILRANHKKALEAVKGLAKSRDKGFHQRWFSWVNKDFDKAENLPDILKCWRWEVTLNADYDIVGIEFYGEKLGEEELLWNTIAPYVEDGSYIHMQGEEGAHWRWVFKNGVMEEEFASTCWPDGTEVL